MPFAKASNDGKIYYEVHGEGAPVLLVPGIGGSSSYWKPQIEPFAIRNRVVLHDHRGTGNSSKDDLEYSVELMTDDMVAVMDHLDLVTAHIVGHSTGAAMAMDMALRYPDRIASAVLYAGWIHRDAYFARVFEIRKELLLKSGPAAYVKTTPLFLNPPWWISENIGRIEADEPAAVESFPPVPIMISRINAICEFGPGERVREIRSPSLVICAKDDHLTPIHFSKELAELIPSADCFYFEQGGHAVSQTFPEQFNEVVLSYIGAKARGLPWLPPVFRNE